MYTFHFRLTLLVFMLNRQLFNVFHSFLFSLRFDSVYHEFVGLKLGRDLISVTLLQLALAFLNTKR